jgi:hypothetical protein
VIDHARSKQHRFSAISRSAAYLANSGLFIAFSGQRSGRVAAQQCSENLPAFRLSCSKVHVSISSPPTNRTSSRSSHVRCTPFATKNGALPKRREGPTTHEQQIKFHHSITSSALTKSVGGTVNPSALAVFRLMTSSNLVLCWIGRSAGLVPLRIFPT